MGWTGRAPARRLRAQLSPRSTRHGQQSKRQHRSYDDIGKNTFHLVGLDERASPGRLCCGGSFSRGQVVVRLANMPPCLIGMEACVGAHHLSRQLLALGHDMKLVPAQFVKPFLKGQKNDVRDAEARG